MALSDRVVTFRGGFTASLDVVLALLDLERRGARFVLVADGGFKVVPPSLLSAEDAAFLRSHRDEARAIVRYQVDVSHLFSDATLAQRPAVPTSELVQ